MSESRAQIDTDIDNAVISGNRSTTAANLRALLKKFNLAAFNLNDDEGLLGGAGLTEWSNAITYKPGDTVLFGYNLWISLSTNINISPSPSTDWSLQIINTVEYTGSGSWTGELQAPTLNSVGVQFDNIYSVISALGTTYLKLDGSSTMAGSINMGGNDITHISKLRRINGTLAIDIDNSAVFAPNGTAQILDFIGSLNMYSYINLNGFSVRKVSLLSNSSNAPVYDLDNAYLFASDGMTINVDIYNKKLISGWIANMNLTNYANDAAAGAGGLITGDLYRTTGAVMIKL